MVLLWFGRQPFSFIHFQHRLCFGVLRFLGRISVICVFCCDSVEVNGNSSVNRSYKMWFNRQWCDSIDNGVIRSIINWSFTAVHTHYLCFLLLYSWSAWKTGLEKCSKNWKFEKKISHIKLVTFKMETPYRLFQKKMHFLHFLAFI